MIKYSARLTQRDYEYIVLAGCSLDDHPGKSNWVEKAGGLPQYICEIARAILRGGKMDKSRAIATAISRVKKWASGAGVDADTQAKASKALAEWEQKKAKAHADNVKASNVFMEQYSLESLKLTVDEYEMPDAELIALAKNENCSESSMDRVIKLSREQKRKINLADLTASVGGSGK